MTPCVIREFILDGKLAVSKTGQMLMGWDKDKKEFIYANKSLKGAEFEIYADGDIETQDNQGDTWFKDGEKIVEARTELTTFTTGEDGTAVCDMMLPVMDKGYVASGSAVSGAAVTVESATTETENTDGNTLVQALNSGDYYLKEISVCDSYYLDEEPIAIHLEYKDANTPVIYANCVKQNKQTSNEIDKLSVADSTELAGCDLIITDAEGKEIISWTSGDKDSVKVFVAEKEGYQNLTYSFDEKGNLHVNGLLHDKEYTLTETRPADGYVTADAITYMIQGKVATNGSITSVVSIKQEDGSYLEKEDDKNN